MSSSPLALPLANILQPFLMFPGNSVPILWSIISGATINNPVPTPVTDATGSMTVYDQNDNPCPGATNVPAVATSTPGTYSFSIDGTLFGKDSRGNALPLGSGYTTVITMNSMIVGGPAEWTIPTILKDRNSP